MAGQFHGLGSRPCSAAPLPRLPLGPGPQSASAAAFWGRGTMGRCLPYSRLTTGSSNSSNTGSSSQRAALNPGGGGDYRQAAATRITGSSSSSSVTSCGGGATAVAAAVPSISGTSGSGRRRPGGDASWVCRAAGPMVRRPPLRLQGRGAESRGGESEGAAAGQEAEVEVAAALLPGLARVRCVQDVPRFDLPLLLGSFRSSTCNAVAVSYCGQSYLLAPAASVVYGSQVRVSLPGIDKPFPARLLHLGLECELAVLGVDSQEFWRALVPYELAPYGLPYLQQQVNVVSYEEGQPRPRTAPGTVMRTEVVTYPSALQRLLGMTVAVALSKDQLGSAVVDSRGACLGVVFGRTAGSGSGNRKTVGGGGGSSGGGGGSSGERWGQGRRRVGRRRGRRGQTEASASVVPVPVLAHFLEDIRRHGSYRGFPTLGIQWKRTESAALRRYTGLAPDETGVVITSVNPVSALAAAARPLDVLVAVGGAAVGNDGTVAFRDGADSIHITYHISQFQVGEQVELTLLRGGQRLVAAVTLGVPPRLLPLHLAGRPPPYLVVSGLALTVLSAPFLEGAFGRGWAVRAPVQLLREWHNHPASAEEQVVVVAECQDLGPGSATDGYERRAVMYQRIVRCNGVTVVNLRHLVALVAAAAPPAVTSAAGRGGVLGARRRAAPALQADGSGAAAGTRGTDADAAATEQEADTPEDAEAAESTRGSAGASDGDGSVMPVVSAGAPSESVGVPGSDSTGGNVGGGPPHDPQDLVLELSNRMLVVLQLHQVREDTRAMLAEYEVQHAVSEDLRSVYESGLRRGRGGAPGLGRAAGGDAGGSRGRGGSGRTRAAAGDDGAG